MTPAEQARGLCARRGGSWFPELDAFLSNGFVISTPELFAMGRFCQESPHFPDPWVPWQDGSDFFVWVAVGDLRELVKLLPRDPERIGWFRQGRDWNQNRWVSFKQFASALAKVRVK